VIVAGSLCILFLFDGFGHRSFGFGGLGFLDRRFPGSSLLDRRFLGFLRFAKPPAAVMESIP